MSVAIHGRWTLADGSAPLTTEAVSRLPLYLTRYAQTLGVVVHAVGGTADHLHLLYDLPPDRSLDNVNEELQQAAARFVKSLRGASFTWERGYDAESAGADDRAMLIRYIGDNEDRHNAGTTIPEWEAEVETQTNQETDVPDWLRESMRSEKPTRR